MPGQSIGFKCNRTHSFLIPTQTKYNITTLTGSEIRESQIDVVDIQGFLNAFSLELITLDFYPSR